MNYFVLLAIGLCAMFAWVVWGGVDDDFQNNGERMA